MNAALVAMLGLGLAQPPATSDYHPFNSRNIKFPIQFAPDKVKSVRKVELHVSNDGGQVWQLAAVAPPTQDVFAYVAPADGRYWFHIVTEDLAGKKDPPDLTKEAPAMKVLFDTKAPAVAIASARRSGDEVLVEWKIDDQFPKDEATKVHFRPANATEGWQEVTIPANSRNGVRFAPGVSGPIAVRVSASDLVGNKNESVKEIEGAVAPASSVTSFSPTAGAPTIPPPASIVGPIAGPSAPLAPPSLEPALPTAPPTAPVMVPPAAPMNIVPPAIVPSVPKTPHTEVAGPPMNVIPSVPAPAPMNVIPSVPKAPATDVTGSTGTPIPTFDPRTNVTPASGSSGPVIEQRAQVIGAVHFDLNYQVEQRGPSGISRVDLWVTRDDGKSWVWWSKHEGRDPALKVNLGTTSNSQPEGLYGFRLVPVSGAGLSESAPAAGDAPDMRVIVDTTAPNVKIFPAIADPNAIDALVLQWEASDKNFGDDPITLEWCEGPTGPWRPVAVANAAETLGTAKRLPNTGKHSWKVPAGLPPRVYLKVTAKDAAGNATEQVTREPILVDLTKPRAKITGIGSGPFVRP